MPFDSPNHTQIPNELLGIQHTPGLMADMHEVELKVVLAILRLTLGFHRYEVKCSLSILEKMTGLSRQGVLNGAQAAEDRGLIRRISSPGRGKLTEWELLTTEDFKNVNPVDQLENSQQNRPITEEKVNGVDNNGQQSRLMKETKKETAKEKNKHGASADDDFKTRVSLTTTPARRILRAKFHHSVLGSNKRAPQKFPTVDVADRFDQAAARLNSHLEEAIDAALAQGLNTIIRIVNWIDKYQPNGGKHANSKQQGVSRRVPGYSIADPAGYHDQLPDDEDAQRPG